MWSNRVCCSVAAALLALLGACASTPKTTMLVPSIGQVDALEKLSQRPGTIADVLSVTGQRQWLLLERPVNEGLSGHVIDSSADYQAVLAAPIANVPFDEVALIYYTTPPQPFRFGQWAPVEDAQFPSLPMPGAAEQRASCADLDVELARAETLRWYARNHGAVPFTPSEAAKTHFKNAAKYTALTVAVVAILAAGGGGCCGGGGGGGQSELLSPEAWRWAVTAADRRTIGLLQIKEAKHCAARTIAGADRSDLQVLEQTEIVGRDRVAGRIAESDESAQKTKWLDMLNPAPLDPRP